MKSFKNQLVLLSLLIASNSAVAAGVCDINLFSQEEIQDGYGGYSKTMEKYSEQDSDEIAFGIETIATKESGKKYCNSGSKSCYGETSNTRETRQIIKDNLENVLRNTGIIEFKDHKKYEDKYGTKIVEMSIHCAWGGGLSSQCVKLCTLLDVTSHPGD